MATRKLEQSKVMLEAGASGQAARQRAGEAYLGAQERGMQQAQQFGLQAGALAERGAQRQQQREIATGQQMLQMRGQGLQAAEAGMEQAQGPLPPLVQERMQQLEEQMGKGVEMRAPGTEFEPGEERKAATELKRYQAETERIRAEASRKQANVASYGRAELRGDKQGMENAKKVLVTPLKVGVARAERQIKGEPNEQDWAALDQVVKENSVVPGWAAANGEFIQAVENREPGNERIRAYQSAMIGKAAMEYIETTGEMPKDNDLIDMSSDTMQRFSDNTKRAADVIRMTIPPFQQSMLFRSMDDKVKFQNKLAAWMTKGMVIPAGPDIREPQQVRPQEFMSTMENFVAGGQQQANPQMQQMIEAGEAEQQAGR